MMNDKLNSVLSLQALSDSHLESKDYIDRRDQIENFLTLSEFIGSKTFSETAVDLPI
jgi:hypothetical protein